MVLRDGNALQADILITCIWRQDGPVGSLCRIVSLSASLRDEFDTEDCIGAPLLLEMNLCFNESIAVISCIDSICMEDGRHSCGMRALKPDHRFHNGYQNIGNFENRKECLTDLFPFLRSIIKNYLRLESAQNRATNQLDFLCGLSSLLCDREGWALTSTCEGEYS